VTTTTFKTRK